MENTTRKYSTNTYEYYKTMIDMEVGWLQFLTYFGRLEDVRITDIETKLDEIKRIMINGLDNFLKSNDIDLKNNHLIIKEYLKSVLLENGLELLTKYVGYGIDDKDYNEFITMLYVRNFVKSIGVDLRCIDDELKDNKDEEVRALSTYARELAKVSPKVYLESSVFKESFMSFFVEENGLRFSNEGSSKAYIDMALMLLKRINSYICYMLPSEVRDEVKPVSIYTEHIENQEDNLVGFIIRTLDGIKNNIELLKRVLMDSKEERPARKVLGQ